MPCPCPVLCISHETPAPGPQRRPHSPSWRVRTTPFPAARLRRGASRRGAGREMAAEGAAWPRCHVTGRQDGCLSLVRLRAGWLGAAWSRAGRGPRSRRPLRRCWGWARPGNGLQGGCRFPRLREGGHRPRLPSQPGAAALRRRRLGGRPGLPAREAPQPRRGRGSLAAGAAPCGARGRSPEGKEPRGEPGRWALGGCGETRRPRGPAPRRGLFPLAARRFLRGSRPLAWLGHDVVWMPGPFRSVREWRSPAGRCHCALKEGLVQRV